MIEVKIPIDVQTEKGRYRDSLYIPKTQFDVMSQPEVDVAIQTRVDEWVAQRVALEGIEPPAPTQEELETEAARLAQLLADIQAQLGGE